ncbi:MAG TPA: hypothetical protein VMQ51_16830, partial [Candidatus Binatia bacterium]|nr:hypothetical protein [Candidatus Binatia bacterium]
MVARRRTLSLVVLVLVIVAAGAVPAQGQDFDFTAVPRVTIGLTNQGPVGALGSSGLLNFSKTTGPISTTGTLLSGTDDRLQDPEGTFPISGGSLTFFSGNRSVIGTLGDEILFGQALPNGHGLIAVDTFGPESVVGIGTGLTVLIERHGTTFTQSNLT